MTGNDNNTMILFLYCLLDENQHLRRGGKNSLYAQRAEDSNLKQDIIM